MNAEKIAHDWIAAFNSRDVEKLLSLYDDNAKHYSPKLKIIKPETNGFVTGKAAMRDWWKDAFERLPALHYKLTSLTANEHRVFMEYIRQVPGEPDISVAEVLEIKEKIVASRVYHG